VEQLTQWLARLVEVGASSTERAEVELALARAHAAIPGRLDRCFEHHRAAVALDPELEGTLDESIERARQARRISDVRALLALAVQSTRSDERRLTLLRTLAEAQQAVPADLDGAIDSLAAAGALVPDDVPLLEERLALTQQRARRKRGADAERADLDVVATLHVELARRLPLDAALEAVERALAAQPAHGEALALLEALVAQDPTAQNRARVGKALAARVGAGGRAAPQRGAPGLL
jgi:tetratricopeptide (TPR) repeat protein